MTKTHVINLFGGGGVGKSTIAALVFAKLKISGVNAELVREYVKSWAWANKPVGPADQLYLLGKQSAYESALYGKVDVIVTDSPVILAGAYAEWYLGRAEGEYVTEAALSHLRIASTYLSTTHYNFFLSRGDRPYDSRGRYGTREEAVKFDTYLEAYLNSTKNSYDVVNGTEEEKAEEILSKIYTLLPPLR
jgi:nicotinamide riboside kinase